MSGGRSATPWPGGAGAGEPPGWPSRPLAPPDWPPPVPLSSVVERHRACVCATVAASDRVPAPGIVHTVRLEDGTGELLLVFFGRLELPGVRRGARLQAEGMVGRFRGVPAMRNPRYLLLPPA